jgi:hypothetical protein
MQICYDFIGTVGKQKLSTPFLVTINVLKYHRFHVDFSIIRWSADGAGDEAGEIAGEGAELEKHYFDEVPTKGKSSPVRLHLRFRLPFLLYTV